jgi:hypothetical protein
MIRDFGSTSVRVLRVGWALDLSRNDLFGITNGQLAESFQSTPSGNS